MPGFQSSASSLCILLVCASRCWILRSALCVCTCSVVTGSSCPVAAGLQTAFVKSVCMAAVVFVEM